MNEWIYSIYFYIYLIHFYIFSYISKYNTLSVYRFDTLVDTWEENVFWRVRASTALRRSRNLTKTIPDFCQSHICRATFTYRTFANQDFCPSDISQSRLLPIFSTTKKIPLLPIRHFPIKTFAYFQYNNENKTFAYQTFANPVLIPLSVTFANQ